MDYKSIRDQIKLTDDWINIKTTNCYAYALGLDIPRDKIMSRSFEDPYGVGNIGRFKEKISFFDIYDLSLEDRMQLDLDALDISCVLTSQFDTLNSNDEELKWLIAMYRNTDHPDFHFLRKYNHSYWTHKLGKKGDISCRDSYGNIITNLDKADFSRYNYELSGVYKLTLKR